MSDHSETIRILNTENQEQIIKQHNAELLKIHKLRLVLDTLLEIQAKDLNLPDTEQVDWALKTLSVSHFLPLGNSGQNLLGLNDIEITLSYTERKELREYLIKKLREKCTPIAHFADTMRAELPEMFKEEPKNKSFLNELRELEQKRRENLIKLVEQRNLKVALMKAAAELKSGPCLSHEIELLYAEKRLQEIKAMFLDGVMLNDLTLRNEFSIAALKEVEGFINELVSQATKANN